MILIASPVEYPPRRSDIFYDQQHLPRRNFGENENNNLAVGIRRGSPGLRNFASLAKAPARWCCTFRCQQYNRESCRRFRPSPRRAAGFFRAASRCREHTNRSRPTSRQVYRRRQLTSRVGIKIRTKPRQATKQEHNIQDSVHYGKCMYRSTTSRKKRKNTLKITPAPTAANHGRPRLTSQPAVPPLRASTASLVTQGPCSSSMRGGDVGPELDKGPCPYEFVGASTMVSAELLPGDRTCSPGRSLGGSDCGCSCGFGCSGWAELAAWSSPRSSPMTHAPTADPVRTSSTTRAEAIVGGVDASPDGLVLPPPPPALLSPRDR